MLGDRGRHGAPRGLPRTPAPCGALLPSKIGRRIAAARGLCWDGLGTGTPRHSGTARPGARTALLSPPAAPSAEGPRAAPLPHTRGGRTAPHRPAPRAQGRTGAVWGPPGAALRAVRGRDGDEPRRTEPHRTAAGGSGRGGPRSWAVAQSPFQPVAMATRRLAAAAHPAPLTPAVTAAVTAAPPARPRRAAPHRAQRHREPPPPALPRGIPTAAPRGFPPPPPLSPPPRCGPRGAVGAHSPSGAAARLGHPGGGGGCSAPRAALSPARPRTGSARREHGGGGRGRGRRRCTPSLPPAVPSGPGSRTVPERSGRRDRARRHRHPRYGTAAPRVLQHPWAAPQRLGAPPPVPPAPTPAGALRCPHSPHPSGLPLSVLSHSQGSSPRPSHLPGGIHQLPFGILAFSLSSGARHGPPPTPPWQTQSSGLSRHSPQRAVLRDTVPPAAPISLLFLLSTGLLRATHSLQQQPRFPQPTAGHLAASFCLMGLQQSLEAGHGFGSRWVRLPSPQLSAIARAASATVSAHREGHAIASRHLCVFGAAGAAARTWHRLCRASCRAPFWMLVLSAGLYGSSPACHCHVHSAGRSK